MSENTEAFNLQMLNNQNANYMEENQRLQAEIEPMRKMIDELTDQNQQLTQNNRDMTTERKLQDMDAGNLGLLQNEIEEKDAAIARDAAQISEL